MRPEAYYDISEEDWNLYVLIRNAVERMEDLNPKTEGGNPRLTCHVLAGALAEIFQLRGLTLVHGKYLRLFSHSWLCTRRNNIIDVYPVAHASGPILMCGDMVLTSGSLYVPLSLPAHEEEDWRSMLTSKKFTCAVTETIEKLSNVLSTHA